MRAERGSAVYEAMWGPNEWTLSGALRGWDVRPRLPELTLPTLIIRGEHAPAPTRLIAEMLPALLPAARLEVATGAGHMGPITHAAQVSALIVRHIDEIALPAIDAKSAA